MKIQQRRPATRPSTPKQTSSASQTQGPAKPASGWGPKPTPAAQARALAAHLKSTDGATQAGRIIDQVVKKNDLAGELNWEAGHIKSVKPFENGKFLVDVQLDVIKPNGRIEKNYFGAIVNAQGKVLDVPQG